MGEPGSPIPPPAGGSGRAAPSRRGRGETGFPHPLAYGRAWPSRRGRGKKPGFPIPSPAGGPGPHAGGWGNRVSPSSHPVGGFGRAAPSQEVCSSRRCAARTAWTANMKLGYTNVNISPRRGGWGNRVSPYLSGRGPEARAPRPLGGRSPPKNNLMFITALCGGAAWTAGVTTALPNPFIRPGRRETRFPRVQPGGLRYGWSPGGPWRGETGFLLLTPTSRSTST